MNQRIWIKKLAVFLLAFVLLTGQVFAVPINVSAAKVRKLNAKKVTLTVGKTKQLKVAGIKASKVKWYSSRKSVATVSKRGKIKAKRSGKATITAKFARHKLKCKVTVKAKKSSKNTKAKISVRKTLTPAQTPAPTQKPIQTPNTQNHKVLVAYFSWSGTSERIAQNIISQTGADSFRIDRAVPYSSDYQTTAYGDAMVEAQTNARPAIKDPLASVAQYDKIILCYPIWWHTAPMTVGTFLESYDLTTKTIYPVSQSASMDRSQYDESVTFVKGCAKGATVDNGIFSKDNTAIETYINKIMKE